MFWFWILIGTVMGVVIAVNNNNKKIEHKGDVAKVVVIEERIIVEQKKLGMFGKIFIFLGTILLFPWSLVIWLIYFIMRKRV